ncbi:MAG: EamA family transporter [Rhodospirillaceae bacterium]|nr:EamA family transporter [Rhodospirillaceae bacterium]
MLGAVLSFVGMAIAARELSVELTALQILFWRSFVGALLMPILLSYYGWSQVKSSRYKMQISRGALHCLAQYGWLFGITMIPLAEVFALEFTTPIWTLILASVFLSEKFSFRRVASVGFGFVGVLLILRPGVDVIDTASIVVLGSAGLYAITYVMVKSLARTDTPLCIMFYMTYVQLLLSFIGILLNWGAPSFTLWIWVLFVGAFGLSAHFCMAEALSRSEASLVIPIDFLRLPIIMVLGYLLYSENIDSWLLAGVSLIVLGNYWNVRSIPANVTLPSSSKNIDRK